MKTKLLIILLISLASTGAMAGKYEWTTAWGQGVTEYMVDDGNKTGLNISCSSSDSVGGIATINGHDYGEGEFDLVVDGVVYKTPFITDCRVCDANFGYFWAALRKANNLTIAANGKTAVLPTKNLKNVLQPLSSKKNVCKSGWGM